MKYNYKENNEKINFDYIILDLNPSSSVLNQILISSIDRLIIPITADIYCNMAIDYISIKMPIWKTILSQDGIVLHNNRNISPNSKIYGFIFNMFSLNKKKNNEMASAYENRFNDLLNSINTKIVTNLNLCHIQATIRPIICKIKNYFSYHNLSRLIYLLFLKFAFTRFICVSQFLSFFQSYSLT